MQGLWAGVGHRTCWIAHKLLVCVLEKMALGLSEALAFREGRKIHIADSHYTPSSALSYTAHPTFNYRHIANIVLYINRV